MAGLQHDIVWEDPEANFRRLDPRIARAAATGARLVLLAEMFSTGFSMDTARTAEPVDGPSTTFLATRAREHGIWLAGSVPECPEGLDRPYNQLVLAGPEGQMHRYAKRHPFSYAGEHEHFAAGNEPVTVAIDDLRVTLSVCYDLRFADHYWASAVDTDCYLVPANWPESRRRHWRILLRARAIENQAYVVGVNRVGSARGTLYVGDSAVIDPLGRTLASAAHDETAVLAEVDPERVRAVRRDYPFLPDRR